MKSIKKPLSAALPTGPHGARIVTFADLGTHTSPWGAKEKCGLALEVYVAMGDGVRIVHVTDVVNRTMHPKSSLCRYAEAVFTSPPDELHPEDLVGGAVLVTLKVTQGTVGALIDVAAISPVPAGFHVPPASSPLLLFDIDDPDPSVFGRLPARFKKLLANASSQVPAASPAAGSAPTQTVGADSGLQAVNQSPLPAPNPFAPPETTFWDEIAEAIPKQRENPFQF